jgi:hypothetical protein
MARDVDVSCWCESIRGVRFLRFLGWLPLFGCGAGVPLSHGAFAVDASGADVPVMLSATHATRSGHAISGANGVSEFQSSSAYAKSEIRTAAAAQVLSQIGPGDSWVQIESIVFRAEDYKGWNIDSSRELTIAGMGH